MLPLDMLELEVGLELVPLVDAAKGGELVTRITQIRKNLASEIGVIIPSIHIRDNLRLNPSNTDFCSLVMKLVRRATPRQVPRHGPDWFSPSGRWRRGPRACIRTPCSLGCSLFRERAETLGYTVVDESTVAATHLTEMLRGITPEILGRPEAQELFDIFARSNPRLVDDLIPNLLSMGEVIRVMRNLLEEGVSVRDLRTIREGLADAAGETKDADVLTERVRQRLARHITARFRGQDDRVAALMLDPRVEDVFRGGGPDANEAQRILSSLDNGARAFGTVATPPAVICAPDVRRNVAQFLTRRIPGLSVISYREVDSRTTVRTLGVVSL